jgi:hypothetical protein
MAGGADLAGWMTPEIEAECRAEYGRYKRARNERYTRYFQKNPDFAGGHPLKAKDLASALPAGHEGLVELLPEKERHREHLSGNSSQVLALGLLGPAVLAERTLDWLFASLVPPLPPSRDDAVPVFQFEMTLNPDVLDEQPPRPRTAVDFFANSESYVLCLEAKWTEAGMGTCSCGHRESAACRPEIVKRDRYWETAHEIFGLPPRVQGEFCPIHTGYQAIRNAAAAITLAGDRDPMFVLVYDQTNPYFGGCGAWPGWPTAIEQTLEKQAEERIHFAACSWQDLLMNLPPNRAVSTWAQEKHGLPTAES